MGDMFGGKKVFNPEMSMLEAMQKGKKKYLKSIEKASAKGDIVRII
jgi:hypothetical protein